MVRRRKQGINRVPVIALLLILLICGFVFWYTQKNTAMLPELEKSVSPAEKIIPASEDGETVVGVVLEKSPFDFQELDTNPEVAKIMAHRKIQMGIKDSLDMIVRTDETFIVGDTTVSMGEILKQAALTNKDVYEEKIHESGEIRDQEIKEYGIYVVRPGDNIWNIHFRIIQDFYAAKGIKVSGSADEPLEDGKSSGVGKLLKFSESVVIIYNLQEKRIDSNINLLEPLSKIVIYKMDEVFSLLEAIDYNNVDEIRFDGKTIWIPAKQPVKGA